MKKWTLLTLSLLLAKPVIAQDAVPSVPPVAPATSDSASTPRPVGETGETQSAATPEGMTNRPGENVFVTLTRSARSSNQLPTTADVVTQDDIKKYNALNAGQAVARQTSVQTLPVGGLGSLNTARIRGSSSAQTLVMVDGRPVAGVSLGSQDLAEIPVESIDHIEILRGGISSLYGPNALGGVINVITKRATYSGSPISHVSVEGGSFDRQAYRLDFGSRYGPLDYFFYGDQQWESGFRDNADARTHNIGGNAGLSMGKAGKVLVDVSAYHGNLGTPGFACGPQDPTCSSFVYLEPNQFNNKDEKIGNSPTGRSITDTNALRTSYILPLPAEMLLALRYFHSQRDLDLDDANNSVPSNAVSNMRHELSNGTEAQLNLPLGLMVGGSFTHDREENTDRLVASNSFQAFIENWGVFIQEDFHQGAFSLIPSWRYDHNSVVGENNSPRVQAIADASDWLRFSGSAGKSFRAPTIDDLYTNIGGFLPFTGNPNLHPETAWMYDAGFELHEGSNSLKATYFYNDVKDLIQVEPITFSTVINVGKARRQGAELQLQHYWNKYFKDSWNYTYLNNMGIPSTSDHFVWLAYSPRHTVNATATITPITPLHLDVTARYEDTRYSGNDRTGVKLGSQLIADLRLGYQIRQAELYVGINDVNNKRYQEQPGFPLPGRVFYGGISLRLWG